MGGMIKEKLVETTQISDTTTTNPKFHRAHYVVWKQPWRRLGHDVLSVHAANGAGEALRSDRGALTL